MFTKIFLTSLPLVLAYPAFAHRQSLMTCVSSALGAPSLQVIAEHSAGAPAKYILVQKPLNPTAPATEFALERVQDVDYGSTRIITANHGRSGYAHFYISESGLSLVDINLFNEMLLTTPNGYSCQQNE